jgi:hypothetical protein
VRAGNKGRERGHRQHFGADDRIRGRFCTERFADTFFSEFHLLATCPYVELNSALSAAPRRGARLFLRKHGQGLPFSRTGRCCCWMTGEISSPGPKEAVRAEMGSGQPFGSVCMSLTETAIVR